MLRGIIQVWICLAVSWLATACDAKFGDTGAQGGPPTADAAASNGIDAGDDPADDAAPPPDASVDAGAPCVEGDDRIQDPESGSCYMLFHAAVSFAAAQTACEALGGRLASLTSLEENELASTIAPAAAPLQDIWIGATDAGDEDVFAWLSGEPFVFDHWRSGEPNNGGTNGEDCAVIEGDNNIAGEGCLWDDRACGAAFPYLCER